MNAAGNDTVNHAVSGAVSGAVNDGCLKLTVCFGESDRDGGELPSDALLQAFDRHRATTSTTRPEQRRTGARTARPHPGWGAVPAALEINSTVGERRQV